MADETQDPQQPAPPPAAQSPDELAALRADLEREKAERQRERSDYERKYNDDMRRVAEAWQAAQQQQQPAAPPPADDPDRIISKRDLDEHLKSAQERMVETFSRTQVAAFDSIRQANRERLFGAGDKFPLADKWAAEIDQLANQAFNANPMEMAKPDAYEKIYKLVRGFHVDDLEQSWRQRWEREKADAAAYEDYDDSPVSSAAGTSAPASPAAAPRRQPPPVGDAAGSALRSAQTRRQPRVVLDDPLDRAMCERYFGGDAAAFKRAQDGDMPDVDPFHMKGKSRY